MLKKIVLLAVGAFTASASLFASTDATLETTALKTVLADNPMADLASPEIQQTIVARKLEIQALFDAALTAEGRAAFLSLPPMALGDIIAAFDAPTTARITALLAGQETVTVDGGIGIAGVDALIAKFAVKSIRTIGFETFVLSFDPLRNPNIVAQEFDALVESAYAEVDAYNDGSGFDLVRMGGFPAAYVLKAGWGDCSAGCIYERRFYFEVAGNDVANVGEAGDDMPADDRAVLFK